MFYEILRDSGSLESFAEMFTTDIHVELTMMSISKRIIG